MQQDEITKASAFLLKDQKTGSPRKLEMTGDHNREGTQLHKDVHECLDSSLGLQRCESDPKHHTTGTELQGRPPTQIAHCTAVGHKPGGYEQHRRSFGSRTNIVATALRSAETCGLNSTESTAC